MAQSVMVLDRMFGESTKDVLNSASREIQHPGKLCINQFSSNLAKFVKSCMNVPDLVTL